MSNLTIVSAINSLESFENTIVEMGEENPAHAYIIWNAFQKVAKKIQDKFKEWFQNYYDQNKEVPGGYICKVSNRTTYNFEEDPYWYELNNKLKAREELLKQATDSSLKWNIVMDSMGEVINPVGIKTSEIYSLSKK